MATNNKRTADLEANDFDKIRNHVRAAMLARGVNADELNELMRAFRTLQPVFSAATKWYKDSSEANRVAATEATDKAVAFLLGKFLPEAAF